MRWRSFHSDLAYNQLNGTIPATLGSLASLTGLCAPALPSDAGFHRNEPGALCARG